MIDIIKNALKEAEIKTWRINEKKEQLKTELPRKEEVKKQA